MLSITIPDTEVYDEAEGTLEVVKGQTIQLEHSLLSIKSWESKWHVPFLQKKDRTNEMMIDYVRCMTITKNVDKRLYQYLTPENMSDIIAYIEDPMTATTIKENDEGGKKQIITAEVIYYWMIALEIPFECQKWHLNQLLMLIRVCNINNKPKKKMSKQDLAKYNSKLNAARKAKYGTRG